MNSKYPLHGGRIPLSHTLLKKDYTFTILTAISLKGRYAIGYATPKIGPAQYSGAVSKPATHGGHDDHNMEVMMATNMEVMTMIAYQQQELRATGPEALAQWRELSERAGYPTVNRAAGGFNVRSDACHDGGKDVTGVWVTLNAQGYPRAYCDNHQWPDSDTNFRERVGLPAFEERGSQSRRQGRIDPYQERDGWRVVGAYVRASNGRSRNVYRRDTPEGKQIKQDMHGRMDGYLPLVWRPESPAAEIPAVWVDGEKTAASVRDAGAVAISTIGGHKSAVKAAWAKAGEGERLLVWPDNTPQEVAAAEELVLHLAQLGYVVGVLAPVGEPGTGADAADLPDAAAILEHLQVGTGQVGSSRRRGAAEPGDWRSLGGRNI